MTLPSGDMASEYIALESFTRSICPELARSETLRSNGVLAAAALWVSGVRARRWMPLPKPLVFITRPLLVSQDRDCSAPKTLSELFGLQLRASGNSSRLVIAP